jgi:hypothetical protein
MAITKTHYDLLKLLKARGELPQGGRILEIGEANVYGDFECPHTGDQFEQAKGIYRELFETVSVVSIDADPSRKCVKIDLNEPPHVFRCSFSVCINHGTAEHIFDIANVFRRMHADTSVGGLMIHEAPFTGWLDHGFYCLQPTLFWDVARVNEYKVVLFATEHLKSKSYAIYESREQLLEARRRDLVADNLMLFVALRKTVDAPFRVPIQGVYCGAVSDAAVQAWGELR